MKFLAEVIEPTVDTPLSPDYYPAIFGKMVFALLGCIALLVLTTWALRRFLYGRMQFHSANQQIRLLERYLLSPKSTLYLIESEGKKILIAESQLEIRRLQESNIEELDRFPKEPQNR